MTASRRAARTGSRPRLTRLSSGRTAPRRRVRSRHPAHHRRAGRRRRDRRRQESLPGLGPQRPMGRHTSRKTECAGRGGEHLCALLPALMRPSDSGDRASIRPFRGRTDNPPSSTARSLFAHCHGAAMWSFGDPSSSAVTVCVMDSSAGSGWDSTSGPGEVVLLFRDTGLMRALEDVHTHLESLLETGPRSLTVDLSGVVVTSTTVAALLWVKRRCAARGVEVALRGTSRRSVTMLKRIGFVEAGHRPIVLRSPQRHGDTTRTWSQA